MATGKEMPSSRYTLPNQNRGVPLTGSMPTKAIMIPRQVAISPLSRAPSLKVAMRVSPHSAIIRYSLGPSASMTGRTMGMLKARNTAPISPPRSAAVAEAPRARAAWPCWVMGWPSKTRARLFAAPGTLNRMLVTEPPQMVAMWALSSNARVAASSCP